MSKENVMISAEFMSKLLKLKDSQTGEQTTFVGKMLHILNLVEDCRLQKKKGTCNSAEYESRILSEAGKFMGQAWASLWGVIRNPRYTGDSLVCLYGMLLVSSCCDMLLGRISIKNLIAYRINDLIELLIQLIEAQDDGELVRCYAKAIEVNLRIIKGFQNDITAVYDATSSEECKIGAEIITQMSKDSVVPYSFKMLLESEIAFYRSAYTLIVEPLFYSELSKAYADCDEVSKEWIDKLKEFRDKCL